MVLDYLKSLIASIFIIQWFLKTKEYSVLKRYLSHSVTPPHQVLHRKKGVSQKEVIVEMNKIRSNSLHAIYIYSWYKTVYWIVVSIQYFYYFEMRTISEIDKKIIYFCCCHKNRIFTSKFFLWSLLVGDKKKCPL